MVEENKAYAGVERGAVLLAVTYLGLMTRNKFITGFDVDTKADRVLN
jgi:hypothetical protein